jgi:hypothetical protein
MKGGEMPDIQLSELRRYKELAPEEKFLVSALARYPYNTYYGPVNENKYYLETTSTDQVYVHVYFKGYWEVFTVEDYEDYFRVRGSRKNDKWITINKSNVSVKGA